MTTLQPGESRDFVVRGKEVGELGPRLKVDIAYDLRDDPLFQAMFLGWCAVVGWIIGWTLGQLV